MPITRLYLVRHGQSAGNAEGRFGGHGPTPLSSLGRLQAEATAELLHSEGISAIYSSDLDRALQTAGFLGSRTGIPVNPTKAFRERHVGVLEGLTFDESRKNHPDDYYALVNRNVQHVITDGESYQQLLGRVTHELWKVLKCHQGGRIAIYSHTGAICFITLHLMGAVRRDTRSTPWIVTSNCGINRFEIRGRHNIRVLALNDTRHLADITGNDSFAAR